NWQTMRFKPPPLNQQSIGWRVEFRPMEIQMTDFENAAFSVFTILLSRIVLKYKLNFIIPISKIDQNMSTAVKRDAVNRSKFWFRKDIFTQNTSQDVNNNTNSFKTNYERYESEEESYIEMSINEIMNGYGNEFPGLIPLIRDYVKDLLLDAQTYNKVQQYIQLIADRASAKLQTTAHWIRDFVRKHADYKYDSVMNISSVDGIGQRNIVPLKTIETKGSVRLRDVSDKYGGTYTCYCESKDNYGNNLKHTSLDKYSSAGDRVTLTGDGVTVVSVSGAD
ncbi:unnamed protein product, partial [Medioppia subpectinata]